MSIFILDSNFFIQAHRINYPIDVALGFWNLVKSISIEGKIISIDKVKNEIYKNDDELKKWTENNLPSDFFKNTNQEIVLENYKKVILWADSKKDFYLQKAVNDFFESENADPWLVAFALSLSENCSIVTHEISEPNRKSKIKIPEVCNAFNVNYVNTIQMFRTINVTF
ncbi:MAG: DUF4411 family protein [Ignavibacteriales bacterium]|nr:DUF4411 family protein [Ignavibacteriales bacterium]